MRVERKKEKEKWRQEERVKMGNTKCNVPGTEQSKKIKR